MLYNTQGYNAATLNGPGGIAGTLMEAIRVRLMSLPALANVPVFNRRPTAGAAFPYVLVSQINSRFELNTGNLYADMPEIQFTTLADDDVTAETLGVAAFDALMPNTTNPPLVWADGNETLRLPLFKDRLIPQPGRDKNNKPVFAYIFGYQIWTARGR